MWQGYNLTTNIASITIPVACLPASRSVPLPTLAKYTVLCARERGERERERERERQREEGGERLRVYPSVVAAAASKFD